MKLIVVTPAGRERYLRLLSHYVLRSPRVAEWHLWDNCRTASDRLYLRELAASDVRCKIKELPGATGGWSIIGDFFQFCDDPDAIYLRLDDDIVFIEDGFFERFVDRMLQDRGNALWFAPLIINNTICGSLIKHLSRIICKGPISFQAMCPYAWAYPDFAEALHPVFIQAVKSGRTADFHVPDREIRLSRFSINALGFFGAEKIALGDRFFPLGQGNEEEWVSAALPAQLNRPGKIFGNLLVAHFSFYTQEHRLLQTRLLEAYYELSPLPPPRYEVPIDKKTWKQRLRIWRKPRPRKLIPYDIRLADVS